MTKQQHTNKNKLFNLMRYTSTLVAVWTLVVAGLLVKEFIEIKNYSEQIAENTARAQLDKDKSFRLWASLHGGVYVPVDKGILPNPYLAIIKERDITTPSGKHLTLMNPEYMLRHLNDTFSELYGVAGHITSLKPLRPENGPDEWETAALKKFEQGSKEVLEIITPPHGPPVMRLMQPLLVKPECLKCHGHQGYKVGDIRGGLGIALPMDNFIAHARRQLLLHTLSLIMLWMLGCFGIIFGSERLRKSTTNLTYSNIELSREIDERKKAENALQKESSFTSAILDTAGALIMVLDLNGQIISFNQACERASQFKFKEVSGQVFWETLMTPDGAEQHKTAFEQIGQQPFPKKITSYLAAKDSRRRIIEWSNTTFPGDGSSIEYIICIGIDITEEKQLQAQLLHAEKLSAVGKLSASIAHEINNPLFGIRNVLERMKEKADLNPDNFEFADLAVQECDRIKNMITDLQDFNRPTSGIMTTINLHQVIDNMLLLSKKELETLHITIRKNYGSEIGEIMAISDQIKQVLLNLISNAKEAISNGGFITINTRKVGERVIIEFADTGSGISPNDIDHIFEPFFTTKPAVKGTGLGLSVTYGIIRKHGGDISVTSSINEGTTFTISLPIEGGQND